ncbi:MAG: hypothetical protein ABIA62_08340 [Candidatus Woesearchaeota archaeon]
MARRSEDKIREKLDSEGILPEPDPDKPIRPTRDGPQKLHHHLDHKIVIPLIIMIVALAISLAIYAYFSPPEESFIQASAGPAPPSRADIQGTAGAAAVARTGTGRVSYCQEFVSKGEYSEENSCFEALAMLNSNSDYCYGIDDASRQQNCFRKVAEEYVSISACQELNSPAACLINIAVSTGEMDPCFEIEQMDGELSQNHCLTELARQEKDPEICSFINFGQQPYDRASCTKGAQETI